MALKILLLPTPQPYSDVELQSEVGPRHKEFGGGGGLKRAPDVSRMQPALRSATKKDLHLCLTWGTVKK